MKLNGVEILIERTSRRKTISVFIERDGSVKALVPKAADEDTIRENIFSKEYQIFQKLAKWKELNHGKVHREFVNGQSFLYLGKNYRLRIVEEQNVPLKLSGGFFLLDKNHLPKARQVFEDFYREKTKLKVEERLKIIQKNFSETPTSVNVRDLQHRWASWTPNGGLNFHWKCVMAPTIILDYIITHEMVHLKIPNHSREFWDELDKKMSDYREHKEWLKNNGVKLEV